MEELKQEFEEKVDFEEKINQQQQQQQQQQQKDEKNDNGEDLDDHLDIKRDPKLIKWLQQNLQKDLIQINRNGANPQILQVKNTVVVKKDKDVCNRIEFKSSLDFNTIQQILLSEEVQNKDDPTVFYTSVVLLGKNNQSYMFPYSYIKKSVKDELAKMLKPDMDKEAKQKLQKKLRKRLQKVSNNKLTHWIFVNNLMQESTHVIDNFQDI